MSNMSIKGISKNFFRTAPQKVESNQTNPFGVSFKGNVLTADVFQTAAKNTNIIERAASKSKMLSSAIVGSINNFGSAIGTRLDSIVSFGKRITNNVQKFWQDANKIEISLNLAEARNLLKTEISIEGNRLSFIENQYRMKNLKKLPVSTLEEMMAEEVNAINASRAIMA